MPDDAPQPTPPGACSSATNCLTHVVDPDGTVWLSSNRRPDVRLRVDPDEWVGRPAELGGPGELADARHELDVLKALADAATAGPWYRAKNHSRASVADPDNAIGAFDGPFTRYIAVVGHGDTDEQSNADAKFIAAAREAVPRLIAALERERTERAQWAFEHPDLYRFLKDAARDLGVPITRVADGRTPTEVFRDRKFIGNSQIAPCSVHLKQIPCRRWLEANADPASTTLYVGIDWTTKDANRLPGIAAGWAPWRVEAPLLQPPYLDKRGWMLEARRRGIEPAAMYAMGFEHNNCSGRCVRGGQGQWAHLLRTMPEVYAAAEADEQMLQRELGTDATHLRDRNGGATKPLSLGDLRRRVEASATRLEPLFDPYDWGGCGCMTDDTLAAAVPP